MADCAATVSIWHLLEQRNLEGRPRDESEWPKADFALGFFHEKGFLFISAESNNHKHLVIRGNPQANFEISQYCP